MRISCSVHCLASGTWSHYYFDPSYNNFILWCSSNKSDRAENASDCMIAWFQIWNDWNLSKYLFISKRVNYPMNMLLWANSSFNQVSGLSQVVKRFMVCSFHNLIFTSQKFGGQNGIWFFWFVYQSYFTFNFKILHISLIVLVRTS